MARRDAKNPEWGNFRSEWHLGNTKTQIAIAI
jgi:hypothetical protein